MRNSLRHKVHELMRLDVRYRDSDHDLLLTLWRDYGLELNTQQRLAFRMTPSPDIIIRRRREFSKLYPPSIRVADKRFKQYKEITDEFSNGSWFKRIIKKRGI